MPVSRAGAARACLIVSFNIYLWLELPSYSLCRFSAVVKLQGNTKLFLHSHFLVFIPTVRMDKIQLIYFLSRSQSCQSSLCLPTKWLQSGILLLVLICIFLITIHVNYLSVCLLVVCISFSGRSLFASLPVFLSCLCFSYCFVGV